MSKEKYHIQTEISKKNKSSFVKEVYAEHGVRAVKQKEEETWNLYFNDLEDIYNAGLNVYSRLNR